MKYRILSSKTLRNGWMMAFFEVLWKNIKALSKEAQKTILYTKNARFEIFLDILSNRIQTL